MGLEEGEEGSGSVIGMSSTKGKETEYLIQPHLWAYWLLV